MSQDVTSGPGRQDNRRFSWPLGDSSDIRLEMERRLDRFGHSLVCSSMNVVLCRTVEGNDSQDWPPSPPLQQLSVEQREDGDVALLVGMAGRSHWSASCQLQQQGVIIDVACRRHESGPWLGTTYEVQGQVIFSGGCCCWPLKNGRMLVVRPRNDCRLQLTRSANGARLVIQPSAGGHATARWAYQFEVG